MFDYSSSEIQAIDSLLEKKLAWAHGRHALVEQMALDASRLLSCTEERLENYSKQGFFRRCWFSLSGKTGQAERANQRDLVEMQKHAWRYINLLQERDLLAAHSIISVKNNLLTLSVDQTEIKAEVTRLAERVYNRFIALEERVGNIEASQRIHGWLLTIDTRDYDAKYPENLRLLRVICDFYTMKPDAWNVMEIKYLHKGLKEVGIDLRRSVGISRFIDDLTDEIEQQGYQAFSSLVPPNQQVTYDDDFVIESISAPSFNSLYQIKKNYTSSSRIIKALQNKLEFAHADAIKMVLSDFIDEQGIDASVEVPVKDLATELLACFSLAERLSKSQETLAAVDPGNTAPRRAVPSGATAANVTPEGGQTPRSPSPDTGAEAKGAPATDTRSSDTGKQPKPTAATWAIDEAVISEIKAGDLYALLSVCSNEDIAPLVELILSATTNTLDTKDEYKKYGKDYKKYVKAVGDEIRSFGGHSLRNAFRGEGPPYAEILIDVCKKLDIPCVETEGAILKNEDNLLSVFAPKDIKDMREKDVAAAIENIREKVTSMKNNKGRAAAGFAAGFAAALVSAPVTAAVLINSAMSEAYRITAPCTFYIAYLRKKILMGK